MNLEIISIGDELLIGQTINTNAAWMGEKLIEIGVQVNWVTTVGDKLDYMLAALKIAEDRADVILLTGGLGPTHDDVTKKAIVDYFDTKLVLDEEVLRQVKERFKRRNIPMAPINKEQALVPEIAEVLENNLGTAPGIYISRANKEFYVMPGVPREMQGIMENIILPRLKKAMGSRVIKQLNLMTSGIAESTLFQKLDITALEEFVSVAFLPNLSGVKMRLTAVAESESDALSSLTQAEEYIKARVAEFIYATEDTDLPHAVAALLLEHKKTLAVAESCTGGLVANKLTDIPGSSTWFERGVVSYSNQAKIQLLNIPEALIREHGAVSKPVAQYMAKGVREISGTDYGVSVTGIAGPTGGTDEKPVGLVFIACADENSTIVQEHRFFNDRLGNKERSANAVLNMLRKKIQGLL